MLFSASILDLAGNHAVFLGLVQGVTEFLPISSSGHLVLLSSFVQELDLLFILVLHLGTLCAVLTYYKKDIALITREFIKNPLKPQGMGKWVYCVAIGTLPSVVGAFFLSPLVQKSLAYPNWTGYGFILTGFCLFLTRKAQAQEKSNIYPKMTTVLIVGVSQVLAFFPGISRSGWTIATALLLGVSRKNATLFSFLLAIPAIIGATSFEILSSADLGSYSLTTLCLAFLSAWGFGLLSLKILVRSVQNIWFSWFAFYLWPLGLFVLFFFPY